MEFERGTEPTSENPAGKLKQQGAFSSLTHEIGSWVRDIFFAALTAILIVVFVIQPVKVEGTSMQPHLSDEERIFVNKFLYRFTEIERGDVVVFWYPNDPTKSFIKRVIGLPGDRIEVREGIVYVSGERLYEPYVPAEYFDYQSAEPTVVPEGCFYVMGDHRNSSNDSRHWGPVPKKFIFGKAMFRYWPMSRMGVLD